MEKQTKLFLKHLKTRQDPQFPHFASIIELIKDFIRTRRLILYGGTAIHMALRAAGHAGLVEEDARPFPDLDFYSPTHYVDACALVTEIGDMHTRTQGTEPAPNTLRCIVGKHMQTMRVDVGNNNFLADVSYCPAVVFNEIPTLEYDGMRFVDPMFQRMDLYSSLSFPYKNEPSEVVTERWKKDIERLAMLDDAYPIPRPDARLRKKLDAALVEIVLPDPFVRILDDVLLTGLTAYAMHKHRKWMGIRDGDRVYVDLIATSRLVMPDYVSTYYAPTFTCIDQREEFEVTMPEKSPYNVMVVRVHYMMDDLVAYDKCGGDIAASLPLLYRSLIAMALVGPASMRTYHHTAYCDAYHTIVKPLSTTVVGRRNWSELYRYNITLARFEMMKISPPVYLRRPPNYYYGKPPQKFDPSHHVFFMLDGGTLQDHEIALLHADIPRTVIKYDGHEE